MQISCGIVLPALEAEKPDPEHLLRTEQFHRQHIGSNKNRVWVVIGDKKLTDLKALARYGKVVELKKEDVVR